MRKVVVNSTPLIILCGIGRLDILRMVYQEISIPTAVFREVTAKDDSACAQLKTSGEWIHVEEIKDHSEKKMYKAKLHDGEVEVMILAQEQKADLVILDDNAAKKTAKYLGLPVTGTLGVLIKAKRMGIIESVKSLITELENRKTIKQNLTTPLTNSSDVSNGEIILLTKRRNPCMNQQEILTYIQKQYPTHPDIITKSGYPVTIFKNPRTTAPYAIFYQPAERTTFMEVQAEPDMIGNYIEMYHLAPAKHMDQKHWLAVPLDGSVSDSKVLDLLDMSYDLVDGQAEADGETRTDRQTGADGQVTDSTTEEKD